MIEVPRASDFELGFVGARIGSAIEILKRGKSEHVMAWFLKKYAEDLYFDSAMYQLLETSSLTNDLAPNGGTVFDLGNVGGFKAIVLNEEVQDGAGYQYASKYTMIKIALPQEKIIFNLPEIPEAQRDSRSNIRQRFNKST